MLAVDRAIVAWAHAAMTTAEGFPEAIRSPPHAVEIAISDRRAHRHASGLRSAWRPRAPPDAGQPRDLQCKPHGNERPMKLRKLLGVPPHVADHRRHAQRSDEHTSELQYI